MFLPDQRIVLKQLLTDVKNKTRSLRKDEKSRRRPWLLKKAINNFKSKLHNAGKTLLNPKWCVNFNVEQADLDRHKSSLVDVNYNVPLADI